MEHWGLFAQNMKFRAVAKRITMEKLTLYIRESYDELVHKVTWPTWANLQSTTMVVLVATVIITIIIFLMDIVAKNFMAFIYDLPSYF